MPIRSIVLAGLLALGLVPPLVADAEGGSLSEQVLEMLEADLSEEIVLAWLEGVEPPTARPTAGELVALKKAGATDRLLAALLALSKGDPIEPAPAAEPAPPAVVPGEAPAPVAAGEPGLEGALVDFSLQYDPPQFDHEVELWDLYVYLNGEPLAYVPPSVTFLGQGGQALEFRRRLPSGRHVLRVTQERHVRRPGNRWQHSARVSAQEFVFEVVGGTPAELELTFSEGPLATRSTGPLRFHFLQEERVTDLDGVGGDPETWPLLCEEIEANRAPDEAARGGARRDLEGCVRWASLWGGLNVPERQAVRRALEMFEFKPVPKGS